MYSTLAEKLISLAEALEDQNSTPLLEPSKLRELAALLPSTPVLALRRFLRRHARLQGAAILRELVARPGEWLSAAWLDLLADGGDGAYVTATPPEGEKQPPLLLENPVPYCDAATLRQVRARLGSLKNQLCDTSLNPELSAALDSERQSLERYLRETLAPGGAIRSFYTQEVKAAKRVRAALNRLLEHARNEDPDLHAWLNARLSIGKTCRWRDGEECFAVSGEW